MDPVTAWSPFAVTTFSILALLSALTLRVFITCWWRPLTIFRSMEQQGIHGLRYRFLTGNIPEHASLLRVVQSHPIHSISHDIVPRVVPHFTQWSRIYGERFFYWYGWTPRLVIAVPEFAKQVLSNKFGHYSKSAVRPEHVDLFGNGLPAVNGETWAVHRRVVNPAFRLDRLKGMIPTMLDSANTTFDKWERLCRTSGGCCEIEVFGQFVEMTADIIARTAFGSSYEDGKRVFDLQRQQQVLAIEADRSTYIPGSRFLPTPKNRLRWGLHREIQKQLLRIIHNRIESLPQERGDCSYGNDLLGLMLMANKESFDCGKLILSVQDVMDECKTFLFAGHETSSSLLTWTTMLLAHHKEWQDRARAEVWEVCGSNPPVAESLSELKTISMILNESLRLYPPVVHLIRYSHTDINLGDIRLLKGTGILLSILAMHHSREIWGDDVNDFKPERFAAGAAKAAKHPLAFIPFALGPRVCIGQSFSLLEAKLIISTLLQRFYFQISPSYRHAPSHQITLQPQYGMEIIFKSVNFEKAK